MSLSVADALMSIANYPVPMRVVGVTCNRRGLNVDDAASAEIMAGRCFLLAKADILMYLFNAPNVSQGGQSYSFDASQRANFRRAAMGIYNRFGEGAENGSNGVAYGYKGSRV